MVEYMDYTPLQYWRDYNTDGVPGSGDFKPPKVDIRTFMNAMWERSKGGWITPRDFRATAGQGSVAVDQVALELWAAHPSPWKFCDLAYLSNADITIPGTRSMSIFGAGNTTCGISLTNAGQSGLTRNSGTTSVEIENMFFSAPINKTAGTAVRIVGGPFSRVAGCRFAGVSSSLRMYNSLEIDALTATVEGNYFLLTSNVSADIHNSNPATGGSEAKIDGNWFNSGVISPTGPVAIQQSNGAGPQRIRGNLIQNFDYAYNGYYDGVGSGIGLEFIGNNVASCRTVAVNLQPVGAGATMDLAKIEGNTFNMTGAGRALNIQPGAALGSWLQRWRFANNICLFNQAGFVTTAAGIVGTMLGNEWHGAADVIPINVGTWATGGAGGKIKDNDVKFNITTLANLNGNANWSSAA